jgi:hypothetical protein
MPSNFPLRKRSFIGAGVGARGGVGNWLPWEVDGGVVGSAADIAGIAGAARRLCKLRHVLKILPSACCADRLGGLAGGEAKSAAWRRVKGGGCDGSHDNAEGSSMMTADCKTETQATSR